MNNTLVCDEAAAGVRAHTGTYTESATRCTIMYARQTDIANGDEACHAAYYSEQTPHRTPSSTRRTRPASSVQPSAARRMGDSGRRRRTSDDSHTHHICCRTCHVTTCAQLFTACEVLLLCVRAADIYFAIIDQASVRLLWAIIEVSIWSLAVILLECALFTKISFLLIPHIALQAFYLMALAGILATLFFFCIFRAEADILFVLIGNEGLAKDRSVSILLIAALGCIVAIVIAFEFAFTLSLCNCYTYMRKREMSKMCSTSIDYQSRSLARASTPPPEAYF